MAVSVGRGTFASYAKYQPEFEETPLNRKRAIKCAVSLIGITGSFLAYMHAQDKIPTWVSAMGMGAAAQSGAQSFIDITNYPTLNYFLKNRIKRIGIPTYWWCVQWYKNAGPTGKERAFEVGMGYLSALGISIVDTQWNNFKSDTNIRARSQSLVLPLNNTGSSFQGIEIERGEGATSATIITQTSSPLCCETMKTTGSVYISIFALSILCVVGAFFTNPLDAGTLDFIGYCLMGSVLGHSLWSIAKPYIKEAGRRISAGVERQDTIVVDSSSSATCEDRFVQSLNIVPAASLIVVPTMFQLGINNWYSPLFIGSFTGILLSANRTKLREILENPSDIRGIKLEGISKCLNYLQKFILSGAEIGGLIWFYTEVMKMGKLNQKNFGPFLPAYVTGYGLNLAIPHFFKKYGTKSTFTSEAFSLFCMNHFLFALGFFFILNDKNIGMGSKFVTSTTVGFSATGFGLDAFAMGLQAGIYDTEVISEIIKKYDLPMTEVILLIMWLIGHIQETE